MREGELKKLRREDLLLILIDQQRQIDALKEALKQCEAELENRRVAVENSSSLAEAAFRLNDVYAAAQKAADTYMNEMRARADKTLATAKKVAGEILLEANEELQAADGLLKKARAQAGEEPSPDAAAEAPQAKRRGLFRRRG